ncbi:MAG: hypothetical protein C0598_09675 [Marinilabiliales bacterium]|nr:MAG: hypothetical protein C0598_09675 [Marinilabiliales bacterium]
MYTALVFKRRGEYRKSLFFAGFANIFSFQILIQSLAFITSPFICLEPDITLLFVLRHAVLVLISVIPILLLSSIIRKYSMWILLSFLVVLIFNILIIQGWYLILCSDEQIHNSLYY